jgi:hypothetical protein
LALAGRVMGAMMSGFSALASVTSVDRSDGGSGHASGRSREIHIGLGKLDPTIKLDVRVTWRDTSVTVEGARLQAIDADLNAIPDALPALAVTACFAEGTTRLGNVPQARLKETDRIGVMREELSKMGKPRRSIIAKGKRELSRELVVLRRLEGPRLQIFPAEKGKGQLRRLGLMAQRMMN